MNRYFRALVISLGLLAVVGCSNDSTDDKGSKKEGGFTAPGKPAPDSVLAGQMLQTAWCWNYADNGQNQQQLFAFKSDGTVIYQHIWLTPMRVLDKAVNGKWTLSGNVITGQLTGSDTLSITAKMISPADSPTGAAQLSLTGEGQTNSIAYDPCTKL